MRSVVSRTARDQKAGATTNPKRSAQRNPSDTNIIDWNVNTVMLPREPEDEAELLANP